MARTATVSVLIDDNGSMRLTEQHASRLGGSLDRVTNSARNTDRGLRGTAQMSSNATKNFSKQSQMMGGVLVPAYATLAAQIFALTAVFRFFKEAANLRVLEEGQMAYAQTTGTSLKNITLGLQAATEGQLAFKDAAQAAAIGAAAGFSGAQLKRLAVVAKQASNALGRDLTDSFNRLTRGAIKAEPELLDELGIIIRLQKASEDYGATIGKTAEELTTYEKSQAVLNAILEQGESKFGKFEVKVNQVTLAGKAFNDLMLDMQRTLAPFIELLAKAISQSGLFAAAIAGFAFAAPIKALFPQGAQGFSGMGREESIRNIAGVGGFVGSGHGDEDMMERLRGGQYNSDDFKDLDKFERFGSKEAKQYAAQTRAAVMYETGVMEKGIKGFTTRTKANYLSLLGTSTSGFSKTVAVVKTGAAIMGTALSVALSAVAWVGVLFTVYKLVEELIKVSDTVTEFDEKVKASNGSMDDIVKATQVAARNFQQAAKEGMSLERTMRSISNLTASITFEGQQNMFDRSKDSREDQLVRLKMNKKSINKEGRGSYDTFKEGGFLKESMLLPVRATGQVAALVTGTVTAGMKMFNLWKNDRGIKKIQDEGMHFIGEDQRESLLDVKSMLTSVKEAYEAIDNPSETISGSIVEITNKIKEYDRVLSADFVPNATNTVEIQKTHNAFLLDGVGAAGKMTMAVQTLSAKITAGERGASEYNKALNETIQSYRAFDTSKGLRAGLTSLVGGLEAGAESGSGLDAGGKQEVAVKGVIGDEAFAGALLNNPGRGPELLRALIPLVDKVKSKYLDLYNSQRKALVDKLANQNLAARAKMLGTTEGKIAAIRSETELLLIAQRQELQILLSIQAAARGPDEIKDLATLVKAQEDLLVVLGLQGAKAIEAIELAQRLKDIQEPSDKRIVRLKVRKLELDKTSTQFEAYSIQIKKELAEEQLKTVNLKIEELDLLGKLTISQAAQLHTFEMLALSLAGQVALEEKNVKIQERKQILSEKALMLKKLDIDLDKHSIANERRVGGAARRRNAAIAAERILNKARTQQEIIDNAGDGGNKQLTIQEIRNLEADIKNLEAKAQQTRTSEDPGVQAGMAFAETFEDEVKGAFRKIFRDGDIKEGFTQLVVSLAKQLQDTMANAFAQGLLDGLGITEKMRQFGEWVGKLAHRIGESIGGVFGGGAPSNGPPTAGGGGDNTTGKILGTVASFFGSMFGARSGGIFSILGGGFKGFRDGGIFSGLNGYRTGGVLSMLGGGYKGFAGGGVSRGRDAGYPVMLHGTEAVVPLPDGKSIPVSMGKGAGGTNNVSVNVNVDNQGNSSASTSSSNADIQGRAFANAITRAVQEELVIQSREGGLIG